MTFQIAKMLCHVFFCHMPMYMCLSHSSPYMAQLRTYYCTYNVQYVRLMYNTMV